MKKIINFSLHNKLAVWLFTIIVVVAGIYSGMKMKMETIPNINIPIVSITTVYPGATPQQVLDEVSDPIEQRVRNLSGVEAVNSNSLENVSSIILEYNFDTDMSEAIAEAKEAIEKINFPDGVNQSNVSRISIDAFPIYTASVSDENRSMDELSELVNESVLPEFQGIDGVSSVTVSGQKIKEVELIFQDDNLTKYGLDKETVETMVQSSDVYFPLGLYPLGKEEVSIVVDGNVSTLKDLENILIPNAVKPDLKLKDIATLQVVTKAESVSRTNGEDTISLSIVKFPDANTVEVVREIQNVSEDLENRFDLSVTKTFDQGGPIEDAVFTMIEKALFGAIFAVIVIWLFLRNMKTTLISVISIPLSILIGLLILHQLDITLNIMTLGAMTVAIGRVIDDSIVVVENIFRRMTSKEEPLKGKELITEATKEMFIPILSSTIVTVAVFLPLALVGGMVGELFIPFALTMVFSLAASLVVAITIVPIMADTLFKNGVKETKHNSKPSKLALFYKKVLRWSLQHKVITSAIAIALLVLSIGLIPMIGFSFMPSDEQKMLTITYKPEPGTQQQVVEELAYQVEDYFVDRKFVEMIEFSVGGENPMDPSASNQGVFYIEYQTDMTLDEFEKEKDDVMEKLEELDNKGTWKYMDTTGNMAGGGLTLYVYGENRKEIEPVIDDIISIMKDDEEFENIESSLTDSYTEYRFVAKKEELAQHGLTASHIGMALARNHTKPVLTTVKVDGNELNVYVRTEEKQFESIDELSNIELTSPIGNKVIVKDVAEIKHEKASDSIAKRDGRYYASITADFVNDDIGSASANLQSEIDDLDLPSTVDVNFGGVTEQMTEAFTQLGLAILAAIAIVYLVLVITFGGGLAPFAILFSLPFTIIGALIALLIAGETISVTAFIGVLMLVGIVVTNAIVLVHRIIHKEKEGLSTRDAILEAGVTRLRPILMTALATIGALLPLAFGSGGGGLISKGLGVTVIGGLTSSTLLTLVIVPIVYETLMNIKYKRKSKNEKDSKFGFDNIQVSEIMTPRVDMSVLNIHAETNENIEYMKQSHQNHFFVAKNDKDHIIGSVNAKVFFATLHENKKAQLKEFIEPVLIVNENETVQNVLNKMKKSSIQLAVIVDQHHGTSGFVTFEQIAHSVFK